MKYIMSGGKISLLENSQAVASQRFSQLVSEGFTIRNNNTANNDEEFI